MGDGHGLGHDFAQDYADEGNRHRDQNEGDQVVADDATQVVREAHCANSGREEPDRRDRDLDSREESLDVLVKALNDARVSNALIRQLLDARAAYGNYRGFCRCKEPVE